MTEKVIRTLAAWQSSWSLVVAAPPALMLMGIAVSASLFGIYGLIFGAPIVIVDLMADKVFYVKDVLKDRAGMSRGQSHGFTCDKPFHRFVRCIISRDGIGFSRASDDLCNMQ